MLYRNLFFVSKIKLNIFERNFYDFGVAKEKFEYLPALSVFQSRASVFS